MFSLSLFFFSRIIKQRGGGIYNESRQACDVFGFALEGVRKYTASSRGKEKQWGAERVGKGKLKTKLEKLLPVYPLKHGFGIGVKCPWTNIYRLRLP